MVQPWLESDREIHVKVAGSTAMVSCRVKGDERGWWNPRVMICGARWREGGWVGIFAFATRERREQEESEKREVWESLGGDTRRERRKERESVSGGPNCKGGPHMAHQLRPKSNITNNLSTKVKLPLYLCSKIRKIQDRSLQSGLVDDEKWYWMMFTLMLCSIWTKIHPQTLRSTINCWKGLSKNCILVVKIFHPNSRRIVDARESIVYNDQPELQYDVTDC